MSGAAEMTTADLDRHRIGETEKDVTELTAVVRSLEREVDRLKIETSSVISAVSKLEGRLEERDKNLKASLDRLHERMDARIADVSQEIHAQLTSAREQELLEQGAKAERRRLWRAWFQITGAAVGVGGVLIALVALFVN